MIEFSSALDELDLGRAVLFLERSEQRGIGVQALWRKLADVALEVFVFDYRLSALVIPTAFYGIPSRNSGV